MDQRNVIDMSPFLQDNRHPALREVEGYWQALRAGRLVPRRSDVDPRGIERALEYAFIVERIAPGLARLRIAGSHLGDLMGMEVRGMPISAFFDPGARNLLGEALEQVFDGPATAELTLSAETGIGKPAIDARMLLLPLKSDLGDITRALGCLSTQGPVGRTPRRFRITGHRVTRLVLDGGPVIPAQSPQIAPPAPGMAEDATPYTPPPAAPDLSEETPSPAGSGPAGRPYLRLVKSDDD